jgi:hypothetical protein
VRVRAPAWIVRAHTVMVAETHYRLEKRRFRP